MFALDGLTIGDGFTPGSCPQYNCLSNGQCNICGTIAGYAEGCDITSTTPVCDADKDITGTQDSATRKVAQCVKCTKSSKAMYFISQ